MDSTSADALLADLPPYLAGEELVQRVYGAVANELNRAWTRAQAIREGVTPTTSDDEYLGLSMLEAQLGLPIAPSGQTEAARRAVVLSYIAARRGGRGADWVTLMGLALGGAPWAYFEGPGAFQLTIKVPYAAGSFDGLALENFARAITPAHLDVLVGFDEGFLMGISEVGVESM